MVRTQIQLHERQLSVLKQLSVQNKVSVSEIIRQAVDSLAKNKIQIPQDDPKARALSAIGKFSSGLSDLSEKHDSYFVESIQ